MALIMMMPVHERTTPSPIPSHQHTASEMLLSLVGWKNKQLLMACSMCGVLLIIGTLFCTVWQITYVLNVRFVLTHTHRHTLIPTLSIITIKVAFPPTSIIVGIFARWSLHGAMR